MRGNLAIGMSENLRIVFVCNEYPPAIGGGIGVFVKGMAQALVQNGSSVAVIGYDDGVAEDRVDDDNGVRVIRLKNPYRNAFQIRLGKYSLGLNSIRTRKYLSFKLEELIRQVQPMLVESYDWSGPLWSKPSVPLAMRMHGAHTAHNYYEGKRSSRLLKFFERRNVRIADYFCAVSQHIGEITSRAFSITRPIRILYNFVDTERFRKTKEFDQRDNVVLFVGRVDRRKGVVELFQILRILFELNSEVRSELVGPVNEDFKHSLMEILPEKFRTRVVFRGRIAHSELPSVYSNARLFVMPSRAEAFGLTAVEAMACETATVVTRKASGPELVEDSVSGFLVDFSDCERTAKLLDSWLKDVNLLKRVAGEGRKRVVRLFGRDRMIQENIKFYKEVLGGSNDI